MFQLLPAHELATSHTNWPRSASRNSLGVEDSVCMRSLICPEAPHNNKQRIPHQVPGPKSGLLDGLLCLAIVSVVASKVTGKRSPQKLVVIMVEELRGFSTGLSMAKKPVAKGFSEGRKQLYHVGLGSAHPSVMTYFPAFPLR